MEILGWLIIGLIAGWLAGETMRGHGFGLVGNIIVGIVGAVLGGLLFGLLGFQSTSVLGSLITAFVGSVVLLLIVGMFRRPVTY
jgi:uncharacterized membrane protein YeaQ/YmgE (transglycosylase-associated protein family)